LAQTKKIFKSYFPRDENILQVLCYLLQRITTLRAHETWSPIVIVNVGLHMNMERTNRRTRAVLKKTAVTNAVEEICQINRTQPFV
jgi:hypothetical protein